MSRISTPIYIVELFQSAFRTVVQQWQEDDREEKEQEQAVGERDVIWRRSFRNGKAFINNNQFGSY